MLIAVSASLLTLAMLAVHGGDLASAPPRAVPIYGGSTVGPGQHEAIVGIAAGGALCSGTVVAPRLVLTAAHCLFELDDPADVEISFGNDLHAPAATVAAVDIGTHPDFCDTCTSEPDIFDYGFVVLPSDATVTGGFPVPITDQHTWDEAMAPGSTVTVVGFGEANVEDDGTPIPPTQRSETVGIKREVDIDIIDFTATGIEFLAGGDGKDSCVGDSGGPALVTLADGSMRLAGILSRGFSCGDGGFYGIPLPALPWLEEETGVVLLPEACPEADCVDTTPPQKKGCSIGGPTPAAPLALLILAWRRRTTDVSRRK